MLVKIIVLTEVVVMIWVTTAVCVGPGMVSRDVKTLVGPGVTTVSVTSDVTNETYGRGTKSVLMASRKHVAIVLATRVLRTIVDGGTTEVDVTVTIVPDNEMVVVSVMVLPGWTKVVGTRLVCTTVVSTTLVSTMVEGTTVVMYSVVGVPLTVETEVLIKVTYETTEVGTRLVSTTVVGTGVGTKLVSQIVVGTTVVTYWVVGVPLRVNTEVLVTVMYEIYDTVDHSVTGYEVVARTVVGTAVVKMLVTGVPETYEISVTVLKMYEVSVTGGSV